MFKFVDETEQRVVNFLKRRYKDFQLENQNNGKIIEVTDKDKKTPDWSEQFENENSLGVRFQDDRTNLVKIKEKDPLLIDDVNDQLKRIQKLEALLNYYPQFYETWKKQILPAGVDISLLPIVTAFFNGNTTAIKEELFEKYCKIAVKYSEDIKKKTNQPPTEIQLENYLEKVLKRNGEKLGMRSLLPSKKFRLLRKEIPGHLKRGIGENSIN